MPVCCICQADGVLEALGTWYCIEHVEDGLDAVFEHVSTILGWTPEDRRTTAEWLAS